MSIIGTTADEIGDALLIKISSPFKNVTEIVGYEDEVTGESSASFFEKSFRWSTNNVTYSDWIELTDENLQDLILVEADDFWIQYRYEVADLATGDELTFVSISLEVVTGDGLINGTPQITLSSGDSEEAKANLVVGDCLDEPFQPYDMSRAIKNYEQLSCLVSELFGHEVRYFRVDHLERSRDVILKEHSLYRGEAVKSIKILVPDNELPTQEIAFTALGLEMPDLFEVHITKIAFETAFGTGERPGMRDFLFFPLMDRVYEINSITLPDDFLYTSSYYRVNLTLWQDRASVLLDENSEMQEEIDALTTGLEEQFGEEREDEFEKVRKPNQYNTISTGDKDFVRRSINRKLVIKEEKLRNNFTIVAKYFYQLSSVASTNVTDTDTTALVYRYSDGIPVDGDRAFTFWIRPQLVNAIAAPVMVSTVSDDGGKTKFESTTEHGYVVDDIVRITGTADYNGILKVISVTTTSFTLDVDFITSTAPNPKARKQEVAKFLNYGTDANGFSIAIGSESAIVRVKDTDFIYDLKSDVTLDNNRWYAMTVNFSNTFNQLSLFIWEIKEVVGINSADLNSELSLLSVQTKSLEPTQDFTVDDEQDWRLEGGHADVTNLRIFKQAIEEDEQPLVLCQYVVADSHLSLMVDNGIPQIRLARMHNPR